MDLIQSLKIPLNLIFIYAIAIVWPQKGVGVSTDYTEKFFVLWFHVSLTIEFFALFKIYINTQFAEL